VRGNSNSLSHVPSKRKEEIKSGTSGCGSFVVPYFQPATFIDCFQKIYFILCLILFAVNEMLYSPEIFQQTALVDESIVNTHFKRLVWIHHCKHR